MRFLEQNLIQKVAAIDRIISIRTSSSVSCRKQISALTRNFDGQMELPVIRQWLALTSKPVTHSKWPDPIMAIRPREGHDRPGTRNRQGPLRRAQWESQSYESGI